MALHGQPSHQIRKAIEVVDLQGEQHLLAQQILKAVEKLGPENSLASCLAPAELQAWAKHKYELNIQKEDDIQEKDEEEEELRAPSERLADLWAEAEARRRGLQEINARKANLEARLEVLRSRRRSVEEKSRRVRRVRRGGSSSSSSSSGGGGGTEYGTDGGRVASSEKCR